MKYISNLLVVVAVLCLALLTSTLLFAQEWSAAQKGVWKTVEAHWKIDAQGDLEGFLSYIHPDFRGWSYQDPLPGDKASVKRWAGHRMQREKTLLHELKPVSIQIYGDVAVVLYYYTEVVKDAEGKETTRSGRWTDVWLKQGDGWVAIGWHGGQTSED